MKKIISVSLSILLISACLILPTQAKSVSPRDEYIDLGDGYYTEIILDVEENQGAVTLASDYTTSASKTYNVRDSDNSILCSFTIKAAFYVNPGIVAKCTSVTYSTKINDSHWSFKSPSTTYSGATGTGTTTAVKKVLGITTKSIPIELTIKCDKNGNIS